MQLRSKYIPEDAACATHAKLEPSSITIHWVGPYPKQTPDIVRDWWINSKGEPSAHFVVKDEDVLQCWPLDTVAWHAGCHTGNYQSIGIEVVPEDIDGRFSEKSIKTLKELIAYINEQVGTTLPVVRHYDWSGKKCPQFYVDSNEWRNLLKQIL